MGRWSKILQGLKLGAEMAAPVVPLVNPIAGAAVQVVGIVVQASTNPTPEKSFTLAFNTLGVPLMSYELHVLIDLAGRVKEKLAQRESGSQGGSQSGSGVSPLS